MDNPESTPPPNPAFLAALYQVTARWYTNDAQLVWRRLALFVTLNTGLVTAQIFASHLQFSIRLILPVLGLVLCFFWFFLLRRMWRYQDFQAATLRKQEEAMGLSSLGAYSLAFAIRYKSAAMDISGVHFGRKQLNSRFRNRHFTIALVPVFVSFHLAFICAAVLRVNF